MELQHRQAELEAIFATAPDDQQQLIARLQAGDLSSRDTVRRLEAALDTQDHRREWILVHWPHVVEYAEISRTLEAGAAGPDVQHPIEALSALEGPLGQAATGDERWLRTTVSRLVPGDADSIAPDTIDLLEAIARYRQRWQITHPDPLGRAAETNDQAIERVRLTRWIEDTHSSVDADQQLRTAEQLTLAYGPDTLAL